MKSLLFSENGFFLFICRRGRFLVFFLPTRSVRGVQRYEQFADCQNVLAETVAFAAERQKC